MRYSPISLVSLLFTLLAAVPVVAQERTLRAERIADGVHLISSSYVGDANVVVAEGPAGLLLVDAAMPDVVEALVTAVRGTSGLPIRDVVLTHWHPDHTMGNAQLRAPGMTFWAHDGAQARMRTGGLIEYFGAAVPAYPARALADRTLVEPRVLRLGDDEVRLIPLAPAHTDGDVMVHLPRANVLHMGDVLMGRIYPFVELSSGGDVDGMLAAMDQALALSNERTVIVPGHGPVATRTELQASRDLLATVWARVRGAVAAGASLEEVIAAAPAAEYDAAWATPIIPTDAFVGILYQAASDDGGAGR